MLCFLKVLNEILRLLHVGQKNGILYRDGLMTGMSTVVSVSCLSHKRVELLPQQVSL